ncbi:MAG: hypothetical protein K8U03_10655 [Planctomycetia bacterium]|nr:hypothetical protein [Planctomycetia bacterium]
MRIPSLLPIILTAAAILAAAPLLAGDRARSEPLDALKKLGARITFDERNEVIGVHLGERKLTDADLIHLRGLRHLEELDLTRTGISGTGLTILKETTSLRKLFLTDTKVDDAAIAHLQGMKNLELLGLSGTKIDDAALPHLEGLTKLKQLFCLGTKVSDAGAEKLRRTLPRCEVTR